MRASYYFLGALLSRFGKAQVACGCKEHWVQRTAWKIGKRCPYLLFVGATMNGMLSAVMGRARPFWKTVPRSPMSLIWQTFEYVRRGCAV